MVEEETVMMVADLSSKLIFLPLFFVFASRNFWRLRSMRASSRGFGQSVTECPLRPQFQQVTFLPSEIPLPASVVLTRPLETDQYNSCLIVH